MNYGPRPAAWAAEREMTNHWSVASGAEAAVRDARRASDNAIRTMFELSQRLELLRQAIERAKTDGRLATAGVASELRRHTP